MSPARKLPGIVERHPADDLQLMRLRVVIHLDAVSGDIENAEVISTKTMRDIENADVVSVFSVAPTYFRSNGLACDG